MNISLKNFMKLNIRYPVLFFIIFLFMEGSIKSNTSLPDDVSVEWIKKEIKFNLPEPFFEVLISIEKDGENVRHIVLYLNKEKLIFDNRMLDGLTNISEPDITYSASDYSINNNIKSFKIYFEYGNPKIINLSNNVPGCPPPCTRSVKNVVIFTINDNYEIRKELLENPVSEER